MKKQKGFTVMSLVLWAIIIVFVLITAMKLVPSLIEYQSIIKIVKTVANDAKDDNTVSDIRAAYTKHANLNDISSVAANDLEISKDGGKVVIDFAYEKRIPLTGNISLLIDYQGSSK